MNPTYFEAVVLVTIQRLNHQGIPCSIDNLVSHAKMGDKTISRAILRLERKGRLEVTRPQGSSPKPFQYKLTNQPTENEYVLAAIHLADKMETQANGATH